jgi:hypothetical protein
VFPQIDEANLLPQPELPDPGSDLVRGQHTLQGGFAVFSDWQVRFIIAKIKVAVFVHTEINFNQAWKRYSGAVNVEM